MQLGTKEHLEKDCRIVLTLDAGGTNLVFTALQGGKEIVDTIILPSIPDDLESCLRQIEKGFRDIQSQIDGETHAISFAFPGPANYKMGIIGDLPNLPAFRGGVALGPFLKEKFRLPVFINNDGNLFTLGEYIFGFLPEVNRQIRLNGGLKNYENLLGLTLGTGFGGGIVCNGQLILGDNSNGAEIWLMRNKVFRDSCADASIGKNKLRMLYSDLTEIDLEKVPPPDVLYRIAGGESEGDSRAAREAFQTMGHVLGDAIANAVTLMDGLVVIGGGICGAAELFMPTVMEELNGKIYHLNGVAFPRMASKAFYLENPEAMEAFIRGDRQTTAVPFSKATIRHDALPRIGVGLSKIGVSKAIALGAYAFAISQLEKGPGF